MAERKTPLAVGVFDHYTQAAEAIEDLWRHGFGQDQVDMVTRGEGIVEQATTNAQEEHEAADGATVGAVAGAGVGAVVGAAALTLIPPLGAVLGGGLLMGMLGGAALGAAGGTFLGPFVALKMSEGDAHYYSRELENGRTVVLVHDPDRRAEALDVLRRHGAKERPAAAR
jgi:hypothetical protein